MARSQRFDAPGAWFHVMNRGIARRTFFETSEDIDVFLEQLAEVVERGDLEVHSYALLTTHYHMLVRSPLGRLAQGMQRVQTEYSRYFNRGRKRDGPLVRGRYASKLVNSDQYRCAVVRYIDRNSVSAGLAARAAEYPFGSAFHYSQSANKGVPWLERSWVEGEVRRSFQLPAYEPARYGAVFPYLPEHLAQVVEARLISRATEDSLEDLIDAAPETVLEWMKRKAHLADGTLPGLPVLAWKSVDTATNHAADTSDPKWKIGRRNGWLVLKVGLARQLCGLGLEAIGAHTGVSPSKVGNLSRLHARLVQSDQEYGQKSSTIASRALGDWKGGAK